MGRIGNYLDRKRFSRALAKLDPEFTDEFLSADLKVLELRARYTRLASKYGTTPRLDRKANKLEEVVKGLLSLREEIIRYGRGDLEVEKVDIYRSFDRVSRKLDEIREEEGSYLP